ncbi:hypothetical protein chiPu_0021236 [Chiloscyllium punctatum]|uniref:Uncharacterized protein n=1 Tax=Chiloscyllium punctatum TaxID=137246 RepID=A0A401RPA5_CHIPU|nr:hypothetical protein [Chiloscyllium punctatum]
MLPRGGRCKIKTAGRGEWGERVAGAWGMLPPLTSDLACRRLSDSPAVKKPEFPRAKPRPSNQPAAEVDPETVLKALFKSSGPSTSAQPTAFKIKL